MSRGSGRRRQCSRADALARLSHATAYLNTARRVRDDAEAGAQHVATGNAVLAAIAASDAICCALLGERPRGADHREAVAVVMSVRRGHGTPAADAKWARGPADDLAQALDSKDDSHYGVAGIALDAQTRAIRAAERLVSAAREVLT